MKAVIIMAAAIGVFIISAVAVLIVIGVCRAIVNRYKRKQKLIK